MSRPGSEFAAFVGKGIRFFSPQGMAVGDAGALMRGLLLGATVGPMAVHGLQQASLMSSGWPATIAANAALPLACVAVQAVRRIRKSEPDLQPAAPESPAPGM